MTLPKSRYWVSALLLAAFLVGGISRQQARTPAPAPVLPLYTVAPSPSGGDDTAALQAAIDALPACGCLRFPTNAVYTITSPLRFYNLDAESFISDGGNDTLPIGHRGCEFIWKGGYQTAGTATKPAVPWPAMFDCLTTRKLHFKGITASLDFNKTPPMACFRFDQVPVAGVTFTLISTNNCVEDCTIVCPAIAGTFVGIDNGLQTTTNADFLRVRNVNIASNSVNGWGYGVRNGHTNCKLIDMERVSVSYATAGFYNTGGSWSMRQCSGSWNSCDAYYNDVTDPCLMQCCRFENSVLGIYVAPTGNAALNVQSCSWGGVTGPCFIDTRARQLLLVGNKFGGTAKTTLAFAQYQQADYGVALIGNRWAGLPSIMFGWFNQAFRDATDWSR